MGPSGILKAVDISTDGGPCMAEVRGAGPLFALRLGSVTGAGAPLPACPGRNGQQVEVNDTPAPATASLMLATFTVVWQ